MKIPANALQTMTVGAVVMATHPPVLLIEDCRRPPRGAVGQQRSRLVGDR